MLMSVLTPTPEVVQQLFLYIRTGELKMSNSRYNTKIPADDLVKVVEIWM